jgi:hypothetical protein
MIRRLTREMRRGSTEVIVSWEWNGTGLLIEHVITSLIYGTRELSEALRPYLGR